LGEVDEPASLRPLAFSIETLLSDIAGPFCKEGLQVLGGWFGDLLYITDSSWCYIRVGIFHNDINAVRVEHVGTLTSRLILSTDHSFLHQKYLLE